MSASLKLTAKLTGLDYSGEIVACGVYAQKRCLKSKNRMICNLLRIIRFFNLMIIFR
jgi:predicted NAD/FAD-binding protein